MNIARVPWMRNQALISLALLAIAVLGAWQAADWIAQEDLEQLIFAAIGLTLCVVAVVVMRDWRSGFYIFLGWLLVEDLIRKYLGNNMAVYFGKDVLVAGVYISLLLAIRKGKDKAFRPPFLFFLSLFFWLGVLQMFNPMSPSILYGLLGLKLYFYYIPLVFVGYALIRSHEDLRKFFAVSLGLAAAVSILGILQAIIGPGFLNPAELAPDLRELGALERTTPISGVTLTLPTSVFVSTGRYGFYLVLAFILGLAVAGYQVLHRGRGRKPTFLVIALIASGALLSGSRSSVVYILASGLVIAAGFIWGAPWRTGQVHRVIRVMRRVIIVGALTISAIVVFFPETVSPRLAFYSETLDPASPTSEIASRSWDYPVRNLMLALSEPNWVFGNGIGTASLGTQYVSRLLKQAALPIAVESGYGTFIVELGILGPILWVIWTVALLVYLWRIVLRLRQTKLFPVAFAIFWFAFLLLGPWTFLGVAPYQNYVLNAHLWLLVGIMFRLPALAPSAEGPPVWQSRWPGTAVVSE